VDLPAEVPTQALLEFIADRLRVQLRAEGERHDVLAAVFAAGADDDLLRLLARTEAVTRFLTTADGADLLTGSRRAANILRIEDRKDGPHRGDINPDQLQQPEEQALDTALAHTEAKLADLYRQEQFVAAMGELARLRPVLDGFFDKVTVNAPEPELRENRLRLLARVGAAMQRAADFSRIEG
jgi:glycyl-tRNA synthetase beta chain